MADITSAPVRLPQAPKKLPWKRRASVKVSHHLKITTVKLKLETGCALGIDQRRFRPSGFRFSLLRAGLLRGVPMQASQHCDGHRLESSAMRGHRDLGVRTAIVKHIAAVANVAGDLYILGQFAFGREYVAVHPTLRKA